MIAGALHPLDWAACLWCLAVLAWLGFAFRRQAGGGFAAWLLGGRRLPWALLGLSMVATSFASDTPLAVTELVGRGGIAGNWLWWSLLSGTTLTACLFAGPWRRSGLSSDVELAALRYGGFPGLLLRVVRSLYMSLFFAGLVLAWVIEAMATVLAGLLDLGPEGRAVATALLLLLAFAYTFSSGLWGVVATDLVQLLIAAFGAVALALLALAEAGGAAGLSAALRAGLPASPGVDPLAFLPRLEAGDLLRGAGLLLVFQVAMQWWASVYPGSEPGGGSYLAQRILAARDEKGARRAVLLYALLHYALRPWPWVVVGLFAAVRYRLPEARLGEGYVLAMRDLLPPGLLGLALAGFLAAFLSTVDSHLNLAAGYLVNDFYRPLFGRQASERRLLAAARIALIPVAAAALWFARSVDLVSEAWRVLLATGAGSGLFLLLRWFWWRVNAWSEIAAMLSSFGAAFVLDPALRRFVLGAEVAARWPALTGLPELPVPDEGARLFLIFGTSTLIALGVTLLTPPVPAARLARFYARVRPAGAWGPVRRRAGAPGPASPLARDLVSWALATAAAFALLFATGKALFGDPLAAAVLFALALLAGLLFWGNRAPQPRGRPLEP